jgi:hypothetical protein
MTCLWDFLDARDRNVMKDWAKDSKLGVQERAQLNQKLDLVERLGFEKALQHKYLAGTSGDFNHIFKVIVKSQRMLRPMLCRGPFEIHEEITLLCGAIEKDFKLHPAHAADDAESRRARLISEEKATKRRSRTEHERF